MSICHLSVCASVRLFNHFFSCLLVTLRVTVCMCLCVCVCVCLSLWFSVCVGVCLCCPIRGTKSDHIILRFGWHGEGRIDVCHLLELPGIFSMSFPNWKVLSDKIL